MHQEHNQWRLKSRRTLFGGRRWKVQRLVDLGLMEQEWKTMARFCDEKDAWVWFRGKSGAK